MMRTVVELTEKDIIQTIANALNVDVCQVSLKYSEVWKGYAQNEHKEHEVSARVVIGNGGAEG
jgi:hypothetical protein